MHDVESPDRAMARASILPSIKVWFLSVRPFAFTASVMPIALSGVAASFLQPEVSSDPLWITFPFYAIAGILLHAGTNVLNDYYDFTHGVDGEEDRDPTHLLPQGLVSPRFMAVSGHVYFLLGIVIGCGIGIWRGPAYVLTGIAAAILAYFYTGARFSFKYVALGDLVVFLLMGPAMVAMGVWAILGTIPVDAVLFSLPVAFLVTAILHGNNLRDIESDRKEGIITVAERLGPAKARHLLALLFMLAFASVAAMIIGKVLPVISLITFVALMPVIRLSRMVYSQRDSGELVTLPMLCANVHMLFSGLLILSLVFDMLMF